MTLINKYNLPITAIILVFTVFTKEIGMINIGSIQIDFIAYPFFTLIFILIILQNKITISFKEISFFLLIIFIGIINLISLNLPLINFLKQFLPILMIYFSIKYIIKNHDIVLIFQQYVHFAYLAAIFGIIQVFLKFFTGIKLLTPFSGIFLDSVALEPSHYLLISLPALIFLIEKKEFKLKFIIIFLSIILTFKLTGIISIVIYYILRNFKRLKRQLIITSLLLLISFPIIQAIPEFNDRIIGITDFIENPSFRYMRNLTVFSLMSNLNVAIINFINTFGLGVGLGGHETTYYQIMTKDIFLDYYYAINAPSAHSLTIRIISELGIIGIFLFIYSFIGILQLKNTVYSAIAWASFSHFIVKSIKLGGYFDYGTLFFLVIILTVIKLDKKNKVYNEN